MPPVFRARQDSAGQWFVDMLPYPRADWLFLSGPYPNRREALHEANSRTWADSPRNANNWQTRKQKRAEQDAEVAQAAEEARRAPPTPQQLRIQAANAEALRELESRGEKPEPDL